MATIKSFTDLEQSKKLAEILPIKSADMFWSFGNIKFVDNDYDSNVVQHIPAWSLAALLSVLPFHLIVNNQRYAFSMHKGLNKDGETYIFRYNVFNTDICLYSTDYYNNPVDACVAMVEKLNELNLL